MKIKTDWSRAYASEHALVRKITHDWDIMIDRDRVNITSRYHTDRELKTLFITYLDEFNKTHNVIAEYDWTSDILTVSLDEPIYTLLELKYSCYY